MGRLEGASVWERGWGNKVGEVEGGVGGVIGLSSIAVTLYGRRPDETAVRKPQ